MPSARLDEGVEGACCVHLQVKTVPYDPRFPATNQARNCYTRYNEFYKCDLCFQLIDTVN